MLFVLSDFRARAGSTASEARFSFEIYFKLTVSAVLVLVDLLVHV